MVGHSDEIKHFLDSFDGDVGAAKEALDDYAHAEQSPAKDSQNYTNGDVILTASHVSKTFKLGHKKVEALKDINLSIGKAEIVAITGPSGSGKSTLMNILGCIDTPDSGQIIVGGQDVTRFSDARKSRFRNQTIGYVFQSFYLQPFLTLRDNIVVPAAFLGKGKRKNNRRSLELLEQVGLADVAEHKPSQLSGGQIQRAAIARALMNQPQIILADEPTGNLDSRNSQRIIDVFKRIRHELGTSVIIITHDTNIASQADRMIVLKDGMTV